MAESSRSESAASASESSGSFSRITRPDGQSFAAMARQATVRQAASKVVPTDKKKAAWWAAGTIGALPLFLTALIGAIVVLIGMANVGLSFGENAPAYAAEISCQAKFKVNEAAAAVPASSSASGSSGGSTTNPSTAASADALPALAVVKYAYAAGWRGEDLVKSVAVAKAESSFRPRAEHLNPNGTVDHGLWQINDVNSDILAMGDPYDPATNARMAYAIQTRAGDWSDWVTSNGGMDIPFIEEARAAVAQFEAGGVDVNTPPAASAGGATTPAGGSALGSSAQPVTVASGTPQDGCCPDGKFALDGKCVTVVGSSPGTVDGSVFDAGNIFSDAVFFNAAALDAAGIQAFLDSHSQGCDAPTCLRNLTFTTASNNDGICQPYQGGTNEKFAVVVARMTTACGINPQVILVMVNKESSGWTRSGAGWDRAMMGYACPDSGPGGSANCDPAFAGAAMQTWGIIHQFARYKADQSRLNYPPGDNKILYNVAGRCLNADGSDKKKDVKIVSIATSILYTYTPYTPTDESLAAYPGATPSGEMGCDSYGIRNTYRMFKDNFGDTGGGRIVSASGSGPSGSITSCNGDREALANKVLANPLMGWRPGREETQKEDVRSQLHCNTLALLDSLMTLGIKIEIMSMKSDHDVDGGYHPRGQALDLWFEAGSGPDSVKVYEFLYRNAAQLKVIQIIWAYPPDLPGIDPGKKCIGQNQNGNDPSIYGTQVDCDSFYGVGTMSGHADHIHTAVSSG